MFPHVLMADAFITAALELHRQINTSPASPQAGLCRQTASAYLVPSHVHPLTHRPGRERPSSFPRSFLPSAVSFLIYPLTCNEDALTAWSQAGAGCSPALRQEPTSARPSSATLPGEQPTQGLVHESPESRWSVAGQGPAPVAALLAPPDRFSESGANAQETSEFCCHGEESSSILLP